MYGRFSYFIAFLRGSGAEPFSGPVEEEDEFSAEMADFSALLSGSLRF